MRAKWRALDNYTKILLRAICYGLTETPNIPVRAKYLRLKTSSESCFNGNKYDRYFAVKTKLGPGFFTSQAVFRKFLTLDVIHVYNREV